MKEGRNEGRKEEIQKEQKIIFNNFVSNGTVTVDRLVAPNSFMLGALFI